MPRFRKITLNLLYFLNVLLIFLLVFEEGVQLPVFLQVTGRMHPLILHFPLVLLFVGIVLEWLTSLEKFNHPATRTITTYVFYWFALGAALTALFGFFLYREGSYLGDEVVWHKWLGTAVSLLAVAIILSKDKSPVIYYGTLAATSLCLLLAGHIGAEVTHGKGFLTEPITRQWQARRIQIEHPDSAVVFRDVIQPILNEKCLNCHNTNRAKNNLVLADFESIIKGGKNPGAIVPGKAEESLLYQYALLPMDDSLHMPPKEKLQLEREEIRLIGWWINTGASAEEKYVNLPKTDSIHPIMLSKFQPKTGIDLIDIPFADQEKIKLLNSPYRTVQQISTSKPYIAVFLGSKKDFTGKDLTELKSISDQVVSIDMGNSQVKDEDLKYLQQFAHLQKLHLQNIPITDDGVRHLRGLQFLNVLNLSGTKISANSLEELSTWESLKKLFLYNTTLPEASLSALKNSHPELQVYSTQFDLSDSVYNAQLTIPICKIDSSFFRNQASIEVKLSRGNVKYFYTLDGSEPTVNATLYREPFLVSQSCKFKIMATMSGWIDSKVVTFPLMKLGVNPQKIVLESKPDPKHSGKLDSTLIDGLAGSLNRGDKEYLGFLKEDFQALFSLGKDQRISKITLSFLEDVDKGILAPEYVEVWGGENASSLRKLGRVATVLPPEKRPPAKDLVQVTFPEQSVRFIRLKAKKVGALPAWHPLRKTARGSFFIDELSLE
ncbi:MAG: FN3 associated domain-containing protein [Cyclobacteriaceae bacterium]